MHSSSRRRDVEREYAALVKKIRALTEQLEDLMGGLSIIQTEGEEDSGDEVNEGFRNSLFGDGHADVGQDLESIIEVEKPPNSHRMEEPSAGVTESATEAANKIAAEAQLHQSPNSHPSKKKRKTHSEASILEAIHAIKAENLVLREAADRFDISKSTLGEALSHFDKNEPIKKGRNGINPSKITPDLIEEVRDKVRIMTNDGNAPVLLTHKGSNIGPSTMNATNVNSFSCLVEDIRLKKTIEKYPNGVMKASGDEVKPLCIESIRKIANEVGVTKKVELKSNKQKERRTKALGDVYNFVSLALMLQLVSTKHLHPWLTYNYDKSSTFLHDKEYVNMVFNSEMSEAMAKLHRSTTVSVDQAQRRSTNYGALTCLAGNLVAFVIYLVDESYNKDKVETMRLTGKFSFSLNFNRYHHCIY